MDSAKNYPKRFKAKISRVSEDIIVLDILPQFIEGFPNITIWVSVSFPKGSFATARLPTIAHGRDPQDRVVAL